MRLIILDFLFFSPYGIVLSRGNRSRICRKPPKNIGGEDHVLDHQPGPPEKRLSQGNRADSGLSLSFPCAALGLTLSAAGLVRRDWLRSGRRNHFGANDFGRPVGFGRRHLLRSARLVSVDALGFSRRAWHRSASRFLQRDSCHSARPSFSEQPLSSARRTIFPVVVPRSGDDIDLTPTCQRTNGTSFPEDPRVGGVVRLRIRV